MENIQDIDKLTESLNSAIQEIRTKQNEKLELENNIRNIAIEKGKELIEFFKDLEPLRQLCCTLGNLVDKSVTAYALTGFSAIHKKDVLVGDSELYFEKDGCFLVFVTKHFCEAFYFSHSAQSEKGYLLYVDDLEGAKKSIIDAFIKHMQYLEKKSSTLSVELDKKIEALLI